MIRCTLSTSILAPLVALALFALAARGAVQNTRHNINNVFGAGTVQDSQICLPCHAPHNQPDPSQDTLWNHVMPANGYKLYETSPGYVNSARVVGLDQTSKRCLSCHDGTVAVDSYGAYNFATNAFGPTTGTHVLPSAFLIGGGTQDLSSGFHPIGMVYPGLSNDATSWNSAETSFRNPLTWNRITYQGVDAGGNPITVHYVDSGGANISAAGGGFQLGTTEGGTYKNVVGCGSCHTPHSETYQFLVVPNVNSQLCLTCHAS